MALIEEQQSAINNLKTNLMDELNERGILSDPECQKVLERHKKVDSMEAMHELHVYMHIPYRCIVIQ